MRRIWGSVLAAALSIPSFVTPSMACDPKDQLISAAEAAAVPIYAEEALVLRQGAETVAAAPVLGFESRPVADFAEGVDMGFAYFDLPGSSIPTGYFTLRGRIPESGLQVGEQEGAVDLVNADGKVMMTLPATFKIHSTSGSDPLPNLRPTIAGGWGLEEKAEDWQEQGSKTTTTQAKLPWLEAIPAGMKLMPRPPKEIIRYTTIEFIHNMMIVIVRATPTSI